jgi:hypothetical protein
MAYTLLTAGAGLLTQTARTGVNVAVGASGAVSAAAAGNSFVNDGNVILYLASTSASVVTVTISAPGLIDTYGNLTITSLTITIPAGNVTAQRIITPPFPRSIYNQSDGTVHIDYSSVTSVTLAAIQQFRELTQ